MVRFLLFACISKHIQEGVLFLKNCLLRVLLPKKLNKYVGDLTWHMWLVPWWVYLHDDVYQLRQKRFCREKGRFSPFTCILEQFQEDAWVLKKVFWMSCHFKTNRTRWLLQKPIVSHIVYYPMLVVDDAVILYENIYLAEVVIGR